MCIWGWVLFGIAAAFLAVLAIGLAWLAFFGDSVIDGWFK